MILSQQPLPYQAANGQLTATVPRLRFWQVVVVELTSPKGYE